MTTKERFWGVVICAIFGFGGGTLSSFVLGDARAEAAQQTSTVVRAKSFQVINDRGQIVGELRANDVSRGELWLGRDDWTWRTQLNDNLLEFSYDKKLRLRMGVFLSTVKPARAMISIYNSKGDAIWNTE